ncbi:hypothetical protein QJS04_geneDACA020448 [Acorus gramineus]|uniref:Uncharacterized protein n=1 Tax=Acorus gramineus TaxID=55184 RepID=A0AAV9BUJ9_ACOGR|nr:hypothetical protein QJS04_geneDACA020448 [Acorus gramineus]
MGVDDDPEEDGKGYVGGGDDEAEGPDVVVGAIGHRGDRVEGEEEIDNRRHP